MAVAVDFRTFRPENSRDDLMRRIEQAPSEHAAAILEAYDLLQALHEKEILKLLLGLLTAGDSLVNHVVGLISSPEAVNLLRVALMLGNLAKAIDPDKLEAALSASEEKPPSLLALGKQANSPEVRSAMGVGIGLLKVLGETVRTTNGAARD